MESLCNQESLGTWPSCSPRAVLRPGTRAAEPLTCTGVPGDPALEGQGGPSSQHSPLTAQAREQMWEVGSGVSSHPGNQGRHGTALPACSTVPVPADGDSRRRCK